MLRQFVLCNPYPALRSMPKTSPRHATPFQDAQPKEGGEPDFITRDSRDASDGRGHCRMAEDMSHQMAEDMPGWDCKIWQEWAWLPPAQTSSQPKISHSYNSTNMASNTTMENGQALINCLITIASHRATAYQVLPSAKYQVLQHTKNLHTSPDPDMP